MYSMGLINLTINNYIDDSQVSMRLKEKQNDHLIISISINCSWANLLDVLYIIL